MIKYNILIGNKPLKCSDGRTYEFDTIREAVKMVSICYGLNSLLNEVDIAPAKRNDKMPIFEESIIGKTAEELEELVNKMINNKMILTQRGDQRADLIDRQIDIVRRKIFELNPE